MPSFDMLQNAIGHRFRDPRLLSRALTRRAYALEEAQAGRVVQDQEAFRTLGDAVIRLALVDMLVAAGATGRGEISLRTSQAEREGALASIAEGISLGPCLLLGKGEARQGAACVSSVLAESLEALMGAVFLDAGYPAARGTVSHLFAI